MTDKKLTNKKHEVFIEYLNMSTHYKYNKDAHKTGIFIEIGQRNSRTGQYPYNKYLVDNKTEMVVFGNEFMRFYFKRDTLLSIIIDNQDIHGYYHDRSVFGFPLNVGRAAQLADLVIKKGDNE